MHVWFYSKQLPIGRVEKKKQILAAEWLCDGKNQQHE